MKFNVKIVIFLIIAIVLLSVSFALKTGKREVLAQSSCQTTDYCCDVSNPANCGYAIFNIVNGVTTGYLCQLPVPASCKTAQVCDPAPYNCQVVPGGAVLAPTPIPPSLITPTATPTLTPTPSPALTPTPVIPVRYAPYGNNFGDFIKQAVFILVPIGIAAYFLFF